MEGLIVSPASLEAKEFGELITQSQPRQRSFGGLVLPPLLPKGASGEALEFMLFVHPVHLQDSFHLFLLCGNKVDSIQFPAVILEEHAERERALRDVEWCRREDGGGFGGSRRMWAG